MTALGKEGKAYLSGVRYFQIAKGFSDPFSGPASLHPRLDYIMHGIKRDQAEKGVVVKPRLPITPAILDRLQDHLYSRRSHDLMLWAAACTGYFGFLRAGEFMCPSIHEYDPSVHLSLAVDSHCNPALIRIRIKQSKTDPFRVGIDVFLARTDSRFAWLWP